MALKPSIAAKHPPISLSLSLSHYQFQLKLSTMGNRNKREQWAGLERLRYIEKSVYWRGLVNRSDLVETFGISNAQASGDLQSYHEVNPEALQYNLNRKRYESGPEMTLVYDRIPLEEAIRLFLGDIPQGLGLSSSPSPSVDVLQLPKRQADTQVERCVFMAVLHKQRIRVQYFSLHSSTAKWRWIQPHALAHTGHRWHVRAWCEENDDYRDFVLARMAAADWPLDTKPEPPLPPDTAWETPVTLKLAPAPSLTDEQRQAVELEYGMENGHISLTCRQAMEPYLRSLLHLPQADGTQPTGRLVEVEVEVEV